MPAARAARIFSSTASSLPQFARPAVFRCEICKRTPLARATSKASSMASSSAPPSLRMCVA